MQKPVLITGAAGQIGTELCLALRTEYGADYVIAAGHSKPLPAAIRESGPVVTLDTCDLDATIKIINRHKIKNIYHLAGVLSARAEADPELAWKVNIDGLRNVLKAAARHSCRVFFPSSIGAFGPQAPAQNTPQVTIQRPTTIYGITKVSGELLCDYYHKRYGVDTRGLRFPGLISYKAPPGGGTTDYAVDIFHAALKNGTYTCFLDKDTRLDMMYMPDALRATVELMEANQDNLIHRNAYNITAMSFSPEELATEIKLHLPDFTISYKVDPIRQAIADSWPDQLDDSAARHEWGWRPQYELPVMVGDMLNNLRGESHAA